VADMAFPPDCFEGIQQKDIEALSQALQIPATSCYSFWAIHYFGINCLSPEPAKSVWYREAASKLVARIRGVPLRDPANSTFKDKNQHGLPLARAILLATYGYAGYRESQWRYGIRRDMAEDEEGWHGVLERARRAQEELFSLVMVAGEAGSQLRQPRDAILTLSGRLSGRREEFLEMLDELGDLLRSPIELENVSIPTRSTNKDELVYRAWAGLRDLAEAEKTYDAAGNVASKLLAVLNVRVPPNSAEKFLRRHSGGHPP
jgi:hypothetical protein